MDKNSAKQLLFDKHEYYKYVTRTIRWLAILLVAATYPLNSQYTLVIFSLIASAVVYNLLWYWPWLTKTKLFGSYISMNTVDNGFALFLVTISGGAHSPYYILFTLMAITVTYWYGYRALIILSIAHVGVAAGLFTVVRTTPVPSAPLRVLLIYMFAIIISGILTERLTQGDRRERQHAIESNREIETERQRLSALLNSIGDSVIALDKTGRTLLYNGATLGLLNTNIQLLDKPVGDYLTLQDEKKQPVAATDLFKPDSGIIRRDDLVYKSPDGSLINLDLTISPITATGSTKDIEGGFIVIMKDITKEKSLDETRDEFVAVTSHELRTPIAIAEANLSLALLPKVLEDPDKIKDAVTKAHDSVVFLGALVEDLSTLAKAERGILDVDLKMVDPEELLNQLKENFQGEAEAKGLKIVTSTGQSLHPILTSPSHISEVLQNFITNAIKYTEKGQVELLAEPSKDNKGSVVFSVHDTGIGISSSDKKKVFDKFFRSEDYRTRTTGGTGLGLYIAQKLADRLSGRIGFDSQLDEGSTFYLEVPPVSQRKEDQGKVVDAQVDDFVSTI